MHTQQIAYPVNMTARETAQFLNRSYRLVLGWLRGGHIPGAQKLGQGWAVYRPKLEERMAEGTLNLPTLRGE